MAAWGAKHWYHLHCFDWKKYSSKSSIFGYEALKEEDQRRIDDLIANRETFKVGHQEQSLFLVFSLTSLPVASQRLARAASRASWSTWSDHRERESSRHLLWQLRRFRCRMSILWVGSECLIASSTCLTVLQGRAASWSICRVEERARQPLRSKCQPSRQYARASGTSSQTLSLRPCCKCRTTRLGTLRECLLLGLLH